MPCLCGFELYSRWVPLSHLFQAFVPVSLYFYSFCLYAFEFYLSMNENKNGFIITKKAK